MTYKFARRASQLKENIIKEVLKVTEDTDMISFAGGLPAAELFPVEQLKAVCSEVLTESGEQALQYSSSFGYLKLREQIVARMSKIGIVTNTKNIMITTGSQQALDLTGKVFIDEGDEIICERPTYLAAIDAFKAYSPNFVEVSMDEDGMLMDELENTLREHPKTKYIYTIPDFQNPTGRTLSLQRRKQMVKLANEYDVIIIEDNPYGAIRFTGKSLPSIKQFDSEHRVIYLSTFSKIFSPGLRLGWICADETIIEKYAEQKQASDLNTDTLTQYIVAKYLEMFDLDEHIANIKKTYLLRREKMLQSLEQYFSKEIKHTLPEGGLFIWLELPESVDAMILFKECLTEKVAFVPGEAFYTNHPQKNTLRLNYSNMNEEDIELGVSRIAKVLMEHYPNK